MDGEKAEKSWDDFALAQLLGKRLLCRAIIAWLKDETDPRAPARLEEYRGHMREINAAIRRKRYGGERPPAQGVGLEALRLKGRAQR